MLYDVQITKGSRTQSFTLLLSHIDYLLSKTAHSTFVPPLTLVITSSTHAFTDFSEMLKFVFNE